MPTCDNCGMYWPERLLCEGCAFPSIGREHTCEGRMDGDGGPNEKEHVCPEPYSYETARWFAAMGSASQPIIVSQTQKARIVLGLKNGPED